MFSTRNLFQFSDFFQVFKISLIKNKGQSVPIQRHSQTRVKNAVLVTQNTILDEQLKFVVKIKWNGKVRKKHEWKCVPESTFGSSQNGENIPKKGQQEKIFCCTLNKGQLGKTHIKKSVFQLQNTLRFRAHGRIPPTIAVSLPLDHSQQ